MILKMALNVSFLLFILYNKKSPKPLMKILDNLTFKNSFSVLKNGVPDIYDYNILSNRLWINWN